MDMKTYNITLDAAQPVRKVLAVPANTQKFGVVVKAENIDGTNLTCSMVDGSETIEATRQDDGKFIFELSSIGQESDREVKIVLEKPAVNIGGLVTDFEPGEPTDYKRVKCAIIDLPAGEYVVGELIEKLSDLRKQALFMAHYIKPATEDASNLVGFTQISIGGEAYQGVVGIYNGANLLPEDAVVKVLADTVFIYNMKIDDPSKPPYVSGDVIFDKAVTSTHDVAIDERVGAVADGEIEVQDPDIVVDSVTIDGETYPVEWKVITIDGEPVVVLAAKVETPESSDSELDSTDTELDSNDSELIGD